MMGSFAEKRMDKRADLSEEAKFKILGEQDEAVSYGYEKAMTKNISRGGVCMVLPYKLDQGNVIRVEIPVEVHNNEMRIKAFCEVQWCRFLQDDQRYEAGLSFIALKEEDAEFLNEFVSEKAM